MSAILKFDFQKRKQLHFSDLTRQKRHNFACDNYIFPKARANKNKEWTHLGTLNDPIQQTVICKKKYATRIIQVKGNVSDIY